MAESTGGFYGAVGRVCGGRRWGKFKGTEKETQVAGSLRASAPWSIWWPGDFVLRGEGEGGT